MTLLAAGHETTAGALAWALERLARHPAVLERLREDGDAYLDAVVKEVLRVRPVLSATPRKAAVPYTVGGWTVPAGIHVTPSPYLAHRRPELWPDPTAFRPERFLDGAPEPLTWLPFGGGTRRCAGAAFATMELKAVLATVAGSVTLRPDRPAGERMRRRGVTLMPARGGRVAAAAAPGDRMTSLFCRHNRLTANCPICSKELEAELRAKAPPRPARARPAPASPLRLRPRAPRPRRAPRAARHAPPRPRGRRRLPQPARPRAARDRGRRAPGRARWPRRPSGSSRPARTRRWPPSPTASRPRGSPSCSPWSGRTPRRSRPRSPRRRRASRTARCPTLPAGHARAVASYRQWAERAGSQAAGFIGEADWSPQRRFARVFERLALPGHRARDRASSCSPTLGAAGLYALERRLARARRGGRRHDAGRQAGAAVRRPHAARAPRARPRRGGRACRSRRSTAAWRCGATPAPRVDLAAELPAAVRAALGLR